ncbi:MAG: phosphoglycerate kinase [Rhizobiales bacterium]|nr:phosphoglycerate kinase [Hyphomicrobiales bacterium]NRB14172.1 phosphoglycerate kinase [Hyphomicrobiales bacterium]
MPKFHTLDDYEVSGKRVLLRVDLNVPFLDGKVSDATRIERVAPTIKELSDKGAIVLLLAHFGRPDGVVVPEMSLAPVAPIVADIVGKPVSFVTTDWLDDNAAVATKDAKNGDIFLLENTRFHAGETKNDAQLAKKMAALGDIYVNDAFSAAHRAHVSTVGIANLLPSAAGRAMEEELNALTSALGEPQHPVIAVVGGAKVSSKLDLLGNLVEKVDALVIGGGMANTFLAALNQPVGNSLCEHDLTGTALEIMGKADAANCKILLPVDVATAKEFKQHADSSNIPVADVADDDMILDIGSRAIAALKREFDNAKTVVWNGPMGAFEIQPFDIGTNELALHVAKLTAAGKLTSVAGGGDTVAALNKSGAAKDFTYISTAGGAFLEWLEGKPLPGVDALNK